MRITVDIDEAKLAAIQKATGIRKKSTAVRKAIDSYIDELQKQRFLMKVLEGRSDYSLTNEELEELSDIRVRRRRRVAQVNFPLIYAFRSLATCPANFGSSSSLAASNPRRRQTPFSSF